MCNIVNRKSKSLVLFSFAPHLCLPIRPLGDQELAVNTYPPKGGNSAVREPRIQSFVFFAAWIASITS